MDEEQFLTAMVADPGNPEPRLVMADWLEDRGDPRAELMRIQEKLRSIDVPRRNEIEARMQQLLRAGVQPVVPTMTNSLGMKFVFIFPGEFLLGENGRQEPEQISEGFWLGQTVVTQRQWQSVMQTEEWKGEGYVKQHPDCPATYVDWEDAAKFCSQLSESESRKGEHYTLPLWEQWEYACRAGTTSDFSFGDDESELGRYAWFADNTRFVGEAYAHRVGQKLPNPWGLFDVHGNVWECCQDTHVPRGGSWTYVARFSQSWYCYGCNSLDAYGRGVRVAAPPT